MNIIVPICFVAIWEAILKFVIQEDDDIKKNKIIATSSVFTITASLFIFAAAVFYNIIDNSHKTLFYFVFMIISYAFMFIWQYYARALGKNKIYVLTGIIGTAVNFTLNIFLICFLSMGLKALFISYIFGNVVIAVILETRIKILKRIKIKSVDLKVLKKMFLFSASVTGIREGRDRGDGLDGELRDPGRGDWGFRQCVACCAYGAYEDVGGAAGQDI